MTARDAYWAALRAQGLHAPDGCGGSDAHAIAESAGSEFCRRCSEENGLSLHYGLCPRCDRCDPRLASDATLPPEVEAAIEAALDERRQVEQALGLAAQPLARFVADLRARGRMTYRGGSHLSTGEAVHARLSISLTDLDALPTEAAVEAMIARLTRGGT